MVAVPVSHAGQASVLDQAKSWNRISVSVLGSQVRVFLAHPNNCAKMPDAAMIECQQFTEAEEDMLDAEAQFKTAWWHDKELRLLLIMQGILFRKCALANLQLCATSYIALTNGTAVIMWCVRRA